LTLVVRLSFWTGSYRRARDEIVVQRERCRGPGSGGSFLASDLSALERLSLRLTQLATHRSAHQRSYALALSSYLAFARGDWDRLVSVTQQIAKLVGAERWVELEARLSRLDRAAANGSALAGDGGAVRWDGGWIRCGS